MARNRKMEIKEIYSSINRAIKLIELAEAYGVDKGSKKFELERMARQELVNSGVMLDYLNGIF